jgi:anti-sigma factor RsiW
MNCKKAEQWLSRALDGELPEKEARRLQEHLAACPACRQLEQDWKACGEVLRTQMSEPVQTPEAAWADVRRAIRLQTPTPQPLVTQSVFNWRIQVASVIVMLAVMGVGVLLLGRLGTTRPEKTASAPAQETVASVSSQPTTEVEMVETSLPDATPMVYEDSSSGMMVIWVMTNGDKEKKNVDS